MNQPHKLPQSSIAGEDHVTTFDSCWMHIANIINHRNLSRLPLTQPLKIIQAFNPQALCAKKPLRIPERLF